MSITLRACLLHFVKVAGGTMMDGWSELMANVYSPWRVHLWELVIILQSSDAGAMSVPGAASGQGPAGHSPQRTVNSEFRCRPQLNHRGWAPKIAGWLWR